MLASSLSGGSGGSSGGGGEGGGGSNQQLVNNLFQSSNYNPFQQIVYDNTDTSVYTRTFLNYMVFDENMQLLSDQSGAIQLKGAPSTWHLLQTSGVKKMKANGYVLTYFSNASNMNVHLDNVSNAHAISILQEEQHYYPHGLVVEDGGQQTTPLQNTYLFEGNKLQREIGLELSHFNARQYDQQIGMFASIDPLADGSGQERFSPYHFVGNDPANFVDPLGLDFSVRGGLVTVTAPRISRLRPIMPHANGFYGNEEGNDGDAWGPGQTYPGGGGSGGSGGMKIRIGKGAGMKGTYTAPKKIKVEPKKLMIASRTQLSSLTMIRLGIIQTDKMGPPGDKYNLGLDNSVEFSTYVTNVTGDNQFAGLNTTNLNGEFESGEVYVGGLSVGVTGTSDFVGLTGGLTMFGFGASTAIGFNSNGLPQVNFGFSHTANNNVTNSTTISISGRTLGIFAAGYYGSGVGAFGFK